MRANRKNFSDSDILYIRSNPDMMTAMELAEKFNISANMVYNIRNDKRYSKYPCNKLKKKSEKLTDDDIKYIIKNPDLLDVKELAEEFDVCIGTIYYALNNRNKTLNIKTKSHNGTTKLTEEDVRFIKSNATSISILELSKMFKVAKATIYDIINERTWKEVEADNDLYKNRFHGKLSKKDMEYIIRNPDFLSVKELSEKFGVDKSTIYRRIEKYKRTKTHF